MDDLYVMDGHSLCMDLRNGTSRSLRVSVYHDTGTVYSHFILSLFYYLFLKKLFYDFQKLLSINSYNFVAILVLV